MEMDQEMADMVPGTVLAMAETDLETALDMVREMALALETVPTPDDF